MAIIRGDASELKQTSTSSPKLEPASLRQVESSTRNRVRRKVLLVSREQWVNDEDLPSPFSEPHAPKHFLELLRMLWTSGQHGRHGLPRWRITAPGQTCTRSAASHILRLKRKRPHMTVYTRSLV